MNIGIPLFAVALLTLSSIFSPGQGAASVEAEMDRTKPPPEAVPVITVSAKGVQIYRCDQASSGPAWTFVSPEATLFAEEHPGGAALGTHAAGPVWRWSDGSAVTGTVILKQSSPEPEAVPWLLLRATPAPGSASAGQLHDVIYVRRSDTHGGVQPATGCDTTHRNAEVRVPYTAKYTFYRTSP